AHEALDLITVHQRLKDRGELESVGGLAYLASLPDVVPSSANLAYYLNIVLEKFTLRKMVNFCGDKTARVYEHEGEVDQLTEEFQRDALKVTDTLHQSRLVPIREIVHRIINHLEER